MRRVVIVLIALAIATTAGAQTSPHEKAAIEALAKEPAASAFPIEVYPVSAPMPDHPGIAGVYVTIPGGGLSPATNAKTGMFTAAALSTSASSTRPARLWPRGARSSRCTA